MTDYHDFFHLFNQTSRHLSKKVNEYLSPLGIFSSQWTVLYYLNKSGPITQAELCHYLNVEAPTMTRTITRLEKAGWVKKSMGRNKREKLIELTDQAHAQYPLWKEAVAEFEANVLEGLSTSAQNNMKEAFRLMNNNLRELE